MLNNSNDPIIYLADENISLSQIILGETRPNPYSRANMTAAWNRLYSDDTELPVTDYYVRFCPADFTQLAALVNLDLVLFEFPLGQTVEQMGDYYLPENPDPNFIPCLYTMIPVGFEFPQVPYTILDELVLAPYNSDLTFTSFLMQGLEHEGHPDMNPRAPLFCDPACENFICCVWQQGEGCEFDHDTPTFCYHPNLSEVCNPWTAGDDWPACLEWEDDEDDEEGAPCGTNVCGCAINCDVRQPGGCVQVEDTELGMEGVQNVKVIWWDGWFKIKKTYTNEMGCWNLSGHRERGKGYMWVEFKNHRAKIRSGLGNTIELWRLLMPVKDYVGQFGGGVYNNIYTQYGFSNVAGSTGQRYWGAASIMNGLAEFEGYALEDGIALPPFGNDGIRPLDVFMTMNGETANAPMLHKMVAQIPGILDVGFLASPFFVGNSDGIFSLMGVDIYDPVFNEGIVEFLWDMRLDANYDDSDQFREDIYHETAHASHFAQVGELYWVGLINAEVWAGGWGNENSFDAGRIAVCESWAEHIGWSYVHRRYGMNTSIGETWEELLERTRNDSPNHIPIGLYHDLIDAIPDINNAFDWDGGGNGMIVDQAAGFNNDILFSLLQPNVNSPLDFITILLGSNWVNATGNTQQDVQNLFNSY